MLTMQEETIRLAVLQRVCPEYRAVLFQRLAADSGTELRLFIGDDIPNSKVRSAKEIPGVDYLKLPTGFIRLRGKVLINHRRLVARLAEFAPQVIITEGESNLLSMFKALWYRRRHQGVKVIHWSLGGVPGKRQTSIRRFMLSQLRKRFDGFIVYSSFGRDILVEQGISAQKITVATNVSDVERHLSNYQAFTRPRSAIRKQLGLPAGFQLIYVGAIERNKRLDLLLDLARQLRDADIHFIVIGDGLEYQNISETVETEGLENVLLLGRRTEGLDEYFYCSDAMILPGRGGMVISEAMAYRLPVILHQADGTEYDLVKNGITGVRLENGSTEEFVQAILEFSTDGNRSIECGLSGQELLKNNYQMAIMSQRITESVHTVLTET